MIDYAWISKLLPDAAFTWRPRELLCWLKKWLISRNLTTWTVHVLGKVLFQCSWVPGEINSRFCSKTQWQMFMLVFGHHFGGHPGALQHDVWQITINLDKTFLCISCLRKIAVTCILTLFLFPDFGLNLLNGLYLFITEFEVRTVSYGPSFFPFDLWSKREALCLRQFNFASLSCLLILGNCARYVSF